MKRLINKKFWGDVFFALLLALFLRTFVVQAYKIPTGSMEPTLLIGDYLLVFRLAYGIRIPYYGYILRWAKPKRGDVVVFVYPKDRTKDFIKRTVAVEDEEISVRNKNIFINNVKINDPWGNHVDPQVDGPPRDELAPYKIPKNTIFVMGDNRDESNDSRFWGTVPIDDVKGKALIIYFSFDSKKNKVRLQRIGKKIE